MTGTDTRRETVSARGHEHVVATHGSTFELTSDDYLTPAGDCIVGVEADRVPREFDDSFVAACTDRNATITAVLEADGHTDRVVAEGHPELSFGSDRSMVVRTSRYVDDRTVAVGADKAAADLDRDLVAALADGASLACSFRVDP